MPTYYARETTVQLSVADIGRSTTLSPSHRQSYEATQNIEIASQEFVKASRNGTLTEDALLDEETGSHVRFLGQARDMPFFIVRAGRTFFDFGLEPHQKRNRRSARLPLPARAIDALQNPKGSSIGKVPDTKAEGEKIPGRLCV